MLLSCFLGLLGIGSASLNQDSPILKYRLSFEDPYVFGGNGALNGPMEIADLFVQIEGRRTRLVLRSIPEGQVCLAELLREGDRTTSVSYLIKKIRYSNSDFKNIRCFRAIRWGEDGDIDGDYFVLGKKMYHFYLSTEEMVYLHEAEALSSAKRMESFNIIFPGIMDSVRGRESVLGYQPGDPERDFREGNTDFVQLSTRLQGGDIYSNGDVPLALINHPNLIVNWDQPTLALAIGHPPGRRLAVFTRIPVEPADAKLVNFNVDWPCTDRRVLGIERALKYIANGAAH